MMYFVLPGSDPSPRTPNSAPNGETGREKGGNIRGDRERGRGGEREYERERGRRDAPPVTPGGVTGDSPSEGCAGTDMAGLGGLDGSPVNPQGVSDESGYPTLPGTNTAGKAEALSSALRSPYADAFAGIPAPSQDAGKPNALWAVTQELVERGLYDRYAPLEREADDDNRAAEEGTTRENDCPTPSGERLSDDLWTRHPLLTASSFTQDAEQTAGGGSDGDS